ncbi:MAG TPA: GNAT family N-acetyltransferase [Actinomycetes bacterium]
MSGVTMRPARPPDFEELVGVFARAELGGPSMAPELAFVQGRLGGQAFVAEAGGELVGASAAVLFGANGWIGGVAVLPEWRGAGLGSALTTAAVRWIADAGAGTASLYATAMGRPVYERLGFVADGRWLKLSVPGAAQPVGTAGTDRSGRVGPAEADGSAAADPDRPAEARPGKGHGPGTTAAGKPPKGLGSGSGVEVRAATMSDLDAVVALDRAVTGEERGRLLRAVWGNGCLVAEDADGRLVGFHAPKPTGGPGATIARDPQAGAALQATWQRQDAGARVVLPEANAAGRRVLEALGYQATGTATLMRRGPAPAHHPERVFGGFNLFWG